jgi:uncharacterized membrane protein
VHIKILTGITVEKSPSSIFAIGVNTGWSVYMAILSILVVVTLVVVMYSRKFKKQGKT